MSGGWLEADKDVKSPGVALGCAAGRFSFGCFIAASCAARVRWL
ncbi:small putative membrane protein [Xanthomonas campestris pv. campestris]|uniref:Small putative membrane protein n=1 Tax=Xanthomonas campestris pv. campestris (strain B100) TaxID=509169 RepID=B0RQJ5_XANCB|nr:small putative membrane protein [Xanthomonas campestris pv. campestris]